MKSEEMAMKIVVLYAIQESQRGLAWFWEGKAKFWAMQNTAPEDWEAMTGQKYQERLDAWENMASRGGIYARAWIFALEELDKETGGALMPFARTFADAQMDEVMGLLVPMLEDNYSDELARLREMKNAYTTEARQ